MYQHMETLGTGNAMSVRIKRMLVPLQFSNEPILTWLEQEIAAFANVTSQFLEHECGKGAHVERQYEVTRLMLLWYRIITRAETIPYV